LSLHYILLYVNIFIYYRTNFLKLPPTHFYIVYIYVILYVLKFHDLLPMLLPTKYWKTTFFLAFFGNFLHTIFLRHTPSNPFISSQIPFLPCITLFCCVNGRCVGLFRPNTDPQVHNKDLQYYICISYTIFYLTMLQNLLFYALSLSKWWFNVYSNYHSTFWLIFIALSYQNIHLFLLIFISTKFLCYLLLNNMCNSFVIWLYYALTYVLQLYLCCQ